jgi:hypothetical protein
MRPLPVGRVFARRETTHIPGTHGRDLDLVRQARDGRELGILRQIIDEPEIVRTAAGIVIDRQDHRVGRLMVIDADGRGEIASRDVDQGDGGSCGDGKGREAKRSQDGGAKYEAKPMF